MGVEWTGELPCFIQASWKLLYGLVNCSLESNPRGGESQLMEKWVIRLEIGHPYGVRLAIGMEVECRGE